MNPSQLAEAAARLAANPHDLPPGAQVLAEQAGSAATVAEPFVFLLTIFLLAGFAGYYVVWNVTPALHSPLMAVTNAISSVIMVGAMLATGLATSVWAMAFGFLAVVLA